MTEHLIELQQKNRKEFGISFALNTGTFFPSNGRSGSIFYLKVSKYLVVTIMFCLLSTTVGMPLEGASVCSPVADSTVFAKHGSCDFTGRAKNGAKTGWEIDLSGWAEMGIYTNSHGAKLNGPMHTKGNERTDGHLDQLYLYGDACYTTRGGVKLGGRADFVYGVDAPGMQSNGDGSFDSGWGRNRHDYGIAAYQLYGTVSYAKWNVKFGKFITPIGWEGTASKDNFFYSHSYCYWIEPSTHTGVLVDYALNDRWTLSGGWTAGNNTGFENRYDDDALMAGLTFRLTDKATIYYWMTVGKTENGFRAGDWRFADFGNTARRDFFIQSLCFEWMPTERFTYVMQYNLRNDADVRAGTFRTSARYAAYGINNHFLYRLNDRWATGLRLEWFRDNGRFGYITEEAANYFQATIGLNWTPNKHLAFRPEIRYDHVMDGDARPFGKGRRSQLSGGIGVLYFF